MRSKISDPASKLHNLMALCPEEKVYIQERITCGLPSEYFPWPYGMPSSADPYVMVIGASPGNSPEQSGSVSSNDDLSYDPPTFGQAHSGFFYRDSKGYWDKVRNLCGGIIKAASPCLTEAEAIAVSGHLNLGVARSGNAADGVVDARLISWVSGLLGSVLSPKIVVCFGLNGILTKAQNNAAWKSAPGALMVDWKKPHCKLDFHGYSFRIWNATRADGESVLVCMWPNHPSRHPFSGPTDGRFWREAVTAFCEFIKCKGYISQVVIN